MDKVLDNAYYKTLPPPHDKMRELYSSFQGKAYGASIKGFFDRNSDMQGAQGWAYNRDMVKAAGLVTPNELQKKNQWTWDKMREYAKKLTKDANGDGKIDVYGVCARLDPWPVEQEMAVYSNGGSLMKLKGGKYTFTLIEPQAIQAMQLWRDMVSVDKTVSVAEATGVDTRTEFLNGRAAMIRLDLYALPNDASLWKFDWGWVFFPKGPRGSYVNPVWGMDVVLLPVGEKDPRAVVEVASALFEVTSNYRDLTKYTSDILNFFMQSVKDKDSLDVIGQMLVKSRLWDDIGDSTKQHDLIDKAMVDAVFGPKSPKAVMDEIAPKVQAVIDDTLNRK
jgi:ABC-type glycerol-3-phosphate transport system substrate-binding protein